MIKKEKDLWGQMVILTLTKCKEKCRIMGSCCDKFYCQIAKECASAHGIHIPETGNKIPYLDNKGSCIVPPQFRPMCTLHQCDIASIGSCIEDPIWTKKYFEIRNQLEEIGFDEHSGMW